MSANFNQQLDAVGPLLTITDEQAARVRALVAGQPDAGELLDAMGLGE